MKSAEELDAERDVQDDMYRHRENEVKKESCPDCCGCGCCGGEH